MPEAPRLRASSRLARQIGTLRRLSWPDRGLLVQASLVIAAVRLSIRLFGFRRVYLRLGTWMSKARREETIESSVRRAHEMARIVEMASRHAPVSSTCLHRSVALWWLLGRQGVACDLRFGARRRDRGLEAHAWVEHHGAILNDAPAIGREYEPLSWIPADHDA